MCERIGISGDSPSPSGASIYLTHPATQGARILKLDESCTSDPKSETLDWTLAVGAGFSRRVPRSGILVKSGASGARDRLKPAPTVTVQFEVSDFASEGRIRPISIFLSPDCWMRQVCCYPFEAFCQCGFLRWRWQHSSRYGERNDNAGD